MGMFSRDKYATGSEFEHFREDWVSRVTYNYDGRYFAEFNGAYNGSEKFGPNYRFAFFPSAAVGWMVSNEKFMQNSLRFLNTLKLRASHGQVGNDNVNGRWLVYDNLDLWRQYAIRIFSRPEQLLITGGLKRVPVSVIRMCIGRKWQRPILDWTMLLLNGLVSGSVEVFSDYRTDVLLAGNSRSVPSYFGVQPATANVGKVRNKGYEIELRLNKTLPKGIRLWANFCQ